MPNISKAHWRNKIKQSSPPSLTHHHIDLILKHPYLSLKGHVGVYQAIHPEVNIDPLIRVLYASGHHCYLPVKVDEQTLSYGHIDDIDNLKTSQGFLTSHAKQTRNIDALDCVIIPCLGLDIDHRRLGRGGGFYDRVVTQNTRSLAILAETQKIPVAIHEQHDCIIQEVIWI